MTTHATPTDERLVDRLLAEYGESHQNHINELIHWICVPAIVWSVVALLWSIPTPAVFASVPLLNWATITLALSLGYYVYMSPPLAVGFLAFAAACMGSIVVYEGATRFPLWGAALGVFVIAWVFQFIGHKIEGKKPSFLEDVQFLMIGPAWLMHFLYRKAGIRY